MSTHTPDSGNNHRSLNLDRNGAESWDANGESSTRPAVPLAELLHQLVKDEAIPPLGSLYALSDLSRADEVVVREQWNSIPVGNRRAVVAKLTEAAREEIDLHLGRLLRIALVDADSEVRSAAIEGLRRDVEPDLVGPLVQMTRNDPAVDVRASAAAALGAYVLAGELDELDVALSMRVEEVLLAILHDETEPLAARCRALESIAYSGEAGVRQLIEDAYYSPYEEMRVSALQAMGRSADIRWRGLVRAELQNPSPIMRVEAAVACGELEVRSALDDLVELLDDEEQLVRLASIFAMGRMGGREARDALRMMLNSESPEDTSAAEMALEEMLFYGDSDGIPLFDESSDEEEGWDAGPWDSWYDDDQEMGIYE